MGTHGLCRGNYPAYSEIYWVFAIDAADIWFGNSVHWDGRGFHNADIGGVSVFYGIRSNKMWASPDGKLYVVGDSGRIAYSQNHGATWQNVASGTQLRFFDVWGSWNKQAGDWEVLAIATSQCTRENALLRLLPKGTVEQLDTLGLSIYCRGIWFVPNQQYYIVGKGVHHKTKLTNSAWEYYPPGVATFYGSSAIDGQSLNDVFVVGSFLEVVHYNGSTWHSYSNEIPISNGVLTDVEYKGNTVVMVGQLNGEAVTIVGHR